MTIRKFVVYATLASTALLFSAAHAGEMAKSGFMSDYTQLEKVTDGTADYRYLAPGAEEQMAQFNAVMIDEPEIFIADDSPYKGAKPSHLAALAESLRSGLITSLSEDMYVVNRAGEKVLFVTMAITNLHKTKKKRGILGYTPAGLVVGGIKSAASSDIAKKANLQSLVFELEAFDSVSGERVVALIDSVGSDVEQPASWEELEVFMAGYGKLIQCRFDNAGLPAEQRKDCLAKD